MALLICGLISIGIAVTASPTNGQAVVRWAAKDLDGLRIDLISNHEIELMSFSTQGFVSVTCGGKGSDGSEWVTAPLYYWHLDSNGFVIVTEDNGTVRRTMKKVSMDKDRITVDDRGQMRVYKLLK